MKRKHKQTIQPTVTLQNTKEVQADLEVTWVETRYGDDADGNRGVDQLILDEVVFYEEVLETVEGDPLDSEEIKEAIMLLEAAAELYLPAPWDSWMRE